MNINTLTMSQQIGRYLGRHSDLDFVEPTSSAKGNIYACQLPKKKLRNIPALAIVDTTAGGQEPLTPTTRFALTLHAEARSNKEAMELLAQVQNILFPGGRTVVLTEDSWSPGIIGAPGSTGTHMLWRIIELSRIFYPQVITPRSPGGLAVAEMGIAALAVPDSITVE